MTENIPKTLAKLTVPIDGLVPYGKNPRRGDVAMIVESLRFHGQYRPIVVRAGSNEVLAGNHTLKAARELGWSKIAATFVDVDDDQAARIVLVDNRANDLAGYDDALVAELLQELAATEDLLAGTGFDMADLEGMLDELDSGEGGPLPDGIDDMPAPPVEPLSKVGDIWVLGPHRVACGDSSDKDMLDALIRGDKVGCLLTDPPYGMNLDTDYSKMPGAGSKAQMVRQPKTYKPVAGDDRAFDASFLRAYFVGTKEQFWFGADYYRSTLSPDDRDGSWLIWDKRKEDGSQDDVIGSSFETCWTASAHQRRLLRHYWCGAFGAPEARNRVHPTQKPTALLVDILGRWAPEGCVVADPFGGSGSTLVAAHLTGRVARLVELDPGYVDVICRRWQEITGEHPVLEATGEPVFFPDPTEET